MGFERYDRIAQQYPSMWPLVVPGYMPILNGMQDIVRALDYRPNEMLDLGCGPGTATIAVAPASNPEGLVTLVDGSKTMLDQAKKILGGHVKCTFLGDFTKKEIIEDVCTPNTYDLALCSFALHHVPDDKKRLVIDQVAKALQPGCIFLLADEIAVDQPGGWDVTERIRGRILNEHLKAGRITREFWELETSHNEDSLLPFIPARIDAFTSWMAHSGLAVSCPICIFGSALLIGLKPQS